jgi:hypothetical protein
MSFLSKVEAEFKKLFGETPSILQKAQSAIAFAAPIIQLVVAETDPKDAATVGNIIGSVKSDISTASAVITDAHGGTPDATALQTVGASLSAVNSNLSALLSAGHIKNTSTQAKITAIVGEFNAVISQLVPAKS